VRCSTEAEVGEAIAAAKAAQPAWAATPLAERIELLKAVCKALDKEALVALIVQEMGKLESEARDEVDGAMDKDEFLDLIADANASVTHDNGLVVREPHGVVAVCSPWNFPADEGLLLALPALAAGNTVVLKPSELVPLTGAKVFEALAAALPPNVVRLVQGDGAVGAALVAGDVQMCTMTGSTGTGKKIMAVCAADLKRLVLELGGKDPMVVFADADLDLAAEHAVTFGLYNCGQVCCSVERVYVAEAAADAFVAKCADRVRAAHSGHGSDPAATIGPLASAMQLAAVAAQVERAVQCGARVVCRGSVAQQAPGPADPGPADGGRRATGASADGNWFPATLLDGVPQDAPITRDETFGPVVAVTRFEGSEAEGVRLANDTEYGLAAYVYTGDPAGKGARVAMQIKAGQVSINNIGAMQGVVPSLCPWVGLKGSGFGSHSGPDGWRAFSNPKSLIFSSAADMPDAAL
jgi:acyl-CoA reductase-like NAD-dependent aldehyde dehydrogenase